MTTPKRDPALVLAENRLRIRAHFLATVASSAAFDRTSAHSGASLWMLVLAEVVAMAQKGAPARSFADWCTRFPLGPTLAAALSIAVGTWVPIARRHPVRLVLCAAAAGAAIAWIRPWRWVTAAAAATTLAVAVDLLTQAQSKDNAWSTFMDFVLQKKGPSRP